MVCLRNICINTLHKRNNDDDDNDDDDDDDNNNNNNNNNNLLARYGYKNCKFSTLFLQFVESSFFWFVFIQQLHFSDFLLPFCLSWWYKVFSFAGYTC
jgi:hypothetical protein